MKENYQLLMEAEIEKNKSQGYKPTLLLHACCAPCSSGVLPVLAEHFKITLFFHNPNISPESEYEYRLKELYRLVEEMGYSDIEIVASDYNEEEFLNIARGREELPEGGARCKDCYRLRLRATAEYARENDFDYFTTTLTVSPYKNAQYLNDIGRELSEEYGIKYLVSDFKKKEGYKKSCENSKKYGLYRQIYCGCVYSKAQAEERMK